MSRKYAAASATCLVAVLALLALDDITTGVEPSLLMEWSMVAFASVWFLAVGVRTWKTETDLMRSHVGVGFLVSLFLLAVSAAPVVATAADDDGLRVVEAAERQDWQAVRALIDAGTDVTATQPDGATALHWAAHWNDAETAGRLIEAGADLDAVNDLGVPPLWIALDGANVDVALRLIEAGADPNARLTTGETMLMTAARHGLRTIVARLLERGADARLAEHERGQSALMWAAAGGHADVARRLLESGGGVRARTTGRFTALLFAARAGDLETVQLLLEAGADLEARAIDGSTPLLVASRSTDALAGIDWRIIPYASGHEETALYLLERGADVTAADRLGRTALHAAVETNRPRLAAALIDAGADVDARFTNPVAALRGDYISRRPYKGATPFWLTARAANLEMMQVLLDAGADPFLPNAFGTTPLMVAAGLGENDARRPADHRVVETVTLLLELGADVTGATPAGSTALHGAAAMWEDGVIQLLVDRGADVNAEDNRGRTPLYLVEYGNANAPSESTAELLRALGAREPVVEQ